MPLASAVVIPVVSGAIKRVRAIIGHWLAVHDWATVTVELAACGLHVSAAEEAGDWDGVEPSSSLASELGAARSYFAGRIAAARASLSPGALAAAIQAIRTEQALAIRAIIDRWRAYFQGRKQKPQRPSGTQPLLRYPGLRQS